MAYRCLSPIATMNGLRMGAVVQLLLSSILLVHVVSPETPIAHDARAHLTLPVYIPPKENTLHSFIAQDADSSKDPPPSYNTTARLPDVMVVSEYFLKVKPYYPAPGIKYDAEKNMTFEGFVSMPATITKPTSVLTLNMLNIKVQNTEVTSFNGDKLVVKETKYDQNSNQFAIILEKPLEVGSVIIISINYTGIINHYRNQGFFYTYYINENHETIWMVATKLEPIHARKVLPCMDEPSYKAVFHIELVYPTAHVALSNMLEPKSTELGEGWSHIAFPPTQAMATYLMVFTVGPYVLKSVKNKDGLLVRSVGWTGQEPYLEFSAVIAGECLHQMAKISGIKFAMEKCDHLGLPEFPSGAMENYGLVMYKYQFIAINPKTMTTYDISEAARTICHEVAHQWFGNLVTTRYWENLFVNEGFATYLMRFIGAKALPEHADFEDSTAVRSDLEPALNFDASDSTHPLIPVIGPYFDRITYKKGGSLLRMLNDVLGEEVMWKGLSNYLTRYANGNADHTDLWRCLTDAAMEAGVPGWCGPVNVTTLMEPYSHQIGFPLIRVQMSSDGHLTLSQEPFLDSGGQWIVPVRTASYDSPLPTIRWLVPPGTECNYGRMKMKSAASSKRWEVVSYASAMYGRVHYDDDSFEALLKKIQVDDVPVGVKVMLIGDEVALIKRAKKMGQPFSYNRLLDVLTTVFHSPNIKTKPQFGTIDIALPQLEFFANTLRDSIDAPLVDALYKKALEVAYAPHLWEPSESWDLRTFVDDYLPIAVKYNIGDSVKRALKLFNEIKRDCALLKSSNGTSWCTNLPPDLHRAIYCAAAKYDNDARSNFDLLMYYYSKELQANPYFYQEYRALLYGLTCAEGETQLRMLIRHFLSSALQPSLLFGWLKANPKASDALLQQIKTKPESVLDYPGLSSYLDAMTYNWRSKRRLKQFVALHNQVKGRLEEEQEKVFAQYEQRIIDNIEWSAEFMPSIMKWMYDNLVVVERVPWDKRLPGNLIVQKYDVEITPYIPGSGQYKPSKNLTFDGKVTITFGMKSRSDEIILNAHRLLIDTDTIFLTDATNRTIEIDPTSITKDFDNGMITIPVAEGLVERKVYRMTISYTGFIFDGPRRGAIVSNHNYYEYNGKQGWIFLTNFEDGPGTRTLMVCADEPAYKAIVKMNVRHPADMTALSNMMSTGTTIEENGWALTSYEESPPMSVYLIAVSVGHFSAQATVSKSGILARAYSWTGMEKYLDYSLMVMAGCIDYMTTYVDYPLPLKKIDLVALPQNSDPGAMENWGLILGHYEVLMVDKDYATVAQLSRVGNVIAHEIVHMWFGDLVTMDWWSDVFIKEGFAKYLSANVHAYTVPDQAEYALDYTRFQVHSDALDYDCSPDHSKPMISGVAPILGKMPYFKGAALLHLLYNTLSPETFQKGLRKFIKKNAFSVSNTEHLWASLTQACAEDNVKDWDGKNLDVSVLMKEWSYEKSFPILKVSSRKDGKVSFEQKSCMNTNTTWKIPIIRRDGSSEKLIWFTGKSGNSPDWNLFLPMSTVDNVRASSMLRIEYDEMSWNDLLSRFKVTAKDYQTQGSILSDALFFAKRDVYEWPRVLDLIHTIHWDNSLIQWAPAFSLMDTLYRNFRYHPELELVNQYMMKMAENVYRHMNMESHNKWETDALGAQLQERMCRMGSDVCLNVVKAKFREFAKECENSRYGTAKCLRITPDYRRTMYCYGLRQEPEGLKLVESLWKYFAEEATYFNRDGDNLLHAMSCINDTSALTSFISSALAGTLPQKIINYIGENDVTGSVLFNYFKSNVEKVLWGNVDFDYYLSATTRDWSSDEQLKRLTHFVYNPRYKLLNKVEKMSWENAIQRVIQKKQWLDEHADSIVHWIEAHILN